MLDVAALRADPEGVQRALRKRGVDVDLDAFLRLDAEHRDTHVEIESLRAERNTISSDIGRLVREGADIAPLKVRAKDIGTRITDAEARQVGLDEQRSAFLDGLPNLPDDDVPAGGKESNVVVRSHGTPPEFDFAPRDHVELAQQHGLIDYERGAKLNGTGSWIYTGTGALLEWALLTYFITTHRRDGYTFILPPHLLLHDSGYVAGQFPKFADDVFQIQQEEGQPQRFLIPTSETALVNLHRDETLSDDRLPLKYFSYTPCYRAEFGGYRAKERGTLRGFQFNKVEMFQYARPDESGQAHEELLAKAEELVAGLGLHYRVSLLAAEDLSAAMAKTFDVEVWLPSLDGYLEVSSVSNSRDYQARRGGIRAKRAGDDKSHFLHTLNASGLATSRLLPAILEQHQHADGSVTVPEVLRDWIGTDVLTPPQR